MFTKIGITSEEKARVEAQKANVEHNPVIDAMKTTEENEAIKPEELPLTQPSDPNDCLHETGCDPDNKCANCKPSPDKVADSDKPAETTEKE